MAKKFLFVIFLLFLGGTFLLPFNSSIAETDNNQLQAVKVEFFYSETCPHCAKEMDFLKNLEEENSSIIVNENCISEEESIDLLKSLYNEYEVPREKWGYVPITFIGDNYFIGYGGDDTTGKVIEEYIFSLLDENGSDPEPIDNPEEETEEPNPGVDMDSVSEEDRLKEANIPLIGKVDLTSKSPLILSIVVGALDGFNACAMVALGFLLAVLVGSGTRKRVFLIGGTFILVSGLVYFLIITAWLELFLCISHIKFITTIIGAAIIIFAISLLKDYFKGVTCKICGIGREGSNPVGRFQQKLFKKMEKFSSGKVSLPLALAGIALVAAGVNIIELCCSLGLPVAFTKVLSSFNLPRISYYFYILVYVTFYMIDDFIIFVIAVLTLRITQASGTYLKAVKLISGILLLVLGIVMIVRPDLLAF
jgi:thiol-disulfide isomerase/thioredoxin